MGAQTGSPETPRRLTASVQANRGLTTTVTTDQVRDIFFSNMSERAAKMLREEIEALGPVRGKDVAVAQFAIVTTAKDLAEKEEIFLSIGAEGGENDLIY